MTQYLWLLPLCHKSADTVATALFDEVISRVFVLSTILTDRGGEFTSKVMQHLYNQLGISHLLTSAYNPQTDAKCKRIHYFIHNMITKLVGEKHDRWLDLLGTVALAYNSTVHSATSYYLHKLFYFFKPACRLDAQVTVPILEPIDNADALECLRETYAFVRTTTEIQAQHMKRQFHAAVRPKTFSPEEFLLLFNSKKKKGLYSKWQVTWTGPVRVEKRLDDSNYVVKWALQAGLLRYTSTG